MQQRHILVQKDIRTTAANDGSVSIDRIDSICFESFHNLLSGDLDMSKLISIGYFCEQ